MLLIDHGHVISQNHLGREALESGSSCLDYIQAPSTILPSNTIASVIYTTLVFVDSFKNKHELHTITAS